MFASVNAHSGFELSRRDDIESLLYTLMYLHKSTLPWRVVQAKKKSERHEIVKDLKMSLTLKNFIELGHPIEFFKIY